MTLTPTLPALNTEEAQQFRDQGFIGPIRAFDEDTMAKVREHLFSTTFTETPYTDQPIGQSRHLDDRVVWELCANPEVIGRMASLYGDDLVLWRSNFFTKHPGDKEIPWHQDMNYWPLEPLVNITAWMAIDEVTEENSCVNLIPGSHKKVVNHVKAQNTQFKEGVDAKTIDTSKAVAMPLKPGEFFLFNEKTLHQSNPNISNKRRCGFAIRVTVPLVQVDHSQLFERHRCIQLNGNDPMGLNKMQARPTGISITEL